MVDRGIFGSGLPTSKPAAGEKGYDLFQFAARAGSASVFLLFVIYMLNGLRSNVLSCSDYNCSSSSPAYHPPNF
ncbi:hypothetical protein V5799_011315 [Amblyomma americanum]|uniref:Uncharacterized protein n=1 Tax=Amblyomma americanum TaxID=6943 RepID=A0AAQ4EH84_AMBAM